MENNKETLELTARYKDTFEGGDLDIEVDLSKLMIHMKFEDNEADVDAETAIRRSILLAQENVVLHTAIKQIKEYMEAEAAKSKIVVAGPNDVPEAPRGS